MLSDTVAEAENFLVKWRRARHLLHRENLVGLNANEAYQTLVAHGNPPEVVNAVHQTFIQRERTEMNHFMNTRLTKSLRAFIKQRPENEIPANVDQCIYLIGKWIDSLEGQKDAGSIKNINDAGSSAAGQPLQQLQDWNDGQGWGDQQV